MKQAAVQRALAKRFALLWVPFLRKNNLEPSLCDEWVTVVPLPPSIAAPSVESTTTPPTVAHPSPSAEADIGSASARLPSLSMLMEQLDAEDNADGDVDTDTDGGTFSDDDGIFE